MGAICIVMVSLLAPGLDGEADPAGWEPVLAALRQTAKGASVGRIDSEWSRNLLASLLPDCEARIYRVWLKGYPLDVLRKGDARISEFGNADDVLALAKAENVVLPDEEKVQWFAVLIKFADRVSRRSPREWELHHRFSGVRRGTGFRVLKLDEQHRPLAVGPMMVRATRRIGGRTMTVEFAYP